MNGQKKRIHRTSGVASSLAAFCGAALMPAMPALAQNIEDLPIDPATPSTPTKPSPALTPPATPSPVTPANPQAGGEMIMVPRAVWEKLLKDVEELKQKNGGVTSTGTPSSTPSETPPPLESTPTAESGAQPSSTGSRNYLLLPDISFIGQAKGLLSSDKRDEARNRLRLSEGELSIQGYVYPQVKADFFATAAPDEDEPFQVEEGYLTFLGVRKGLNINVGRKFAPFGRTGEVHNHSWLYARQILPLANLIAPEALVGDGVNFNYLIPTKGKLFARASLGAFSGEKSDTPLNIGNPADPFFGGAPVGTGASFNRFYNGRLWLGHPVGKNGEFELGASHAHGTSTLDDENGNAVAGRVQLFGADASYRRFMGVNKRLLLRSEYIKYQPKAGLPTNDASGYYALANYRWDKYNDAGLLFERSGFPQVAGVRETAASLIYTKQFTEQFYLRFMGTHGTRGGNDYNQLRLQFTAGIGPHTHSLE